MSRITGPNYGTLDAPGLATVPVAAPQDAAQLLDALRAAGPLANELSYQARRAQAEDDRFEASLEGAGVQFGQEKAPGLVGKIERGEIVVDPKEDSSAAARRLIQEVIPDEEGGPFSRGKEDYAVPVIAKAIENKRGRDASDARVDLFQKIKDAATTATTPEELSRYVQRAQTELGLTETEARDVAVYAMMNAARAGDPQLVDMAAKVLGGAAADEQARARVTLRESRNIIEAGLNSRFIEDITGMLNDRILNNEGSFDAINERIKSYIDNDLIDEKLGNQMLTTVREQRSATEVRTSEAARRAEVRAWEMGETQATVAHLLTTQSSGGAATVKPSTYTDSAGVEHTVSEKDKVSQATEVMFAAIDASAESPAFARRAKMQFLSDTGAPHEPTSTVMNGAVSQVNTDAISRTLEKGEVPALPAAINEGVALWDSMQNDPSLRDRLVTNPEARRFYQDLDIARRMVGGQGPEAAARELPRALLLADKARKAKPSGLRAAPDYLESAVSEFVPVETKNFSDVAAQVNEIADFAQRTGYGPTAAIDEGVRIISGTTKIFHGFAINTSGLHVPEYMEPMADLLAQEYKAAHPEVDVDDLTIIPQADNTWIMFNGLNNLPVENWQTSGVFTADELHAKYLRHQHDEAFAPKIKRGPFVPPAGSGIPFYGAGGPGG